MQNGIVGVPVSPSPLALAPALSRSPLAPAPALAAPRDSVEVSGPASPAAVAPRVASAAAIPSADASFASIVGGLRAPYRATVEAALAALPPEVPHALADAGYRILVVEPDGPAPFGFTPYPVDALRGADVSQAVPKGRKLELNGARITVERSDPYFTFADLARQRGAETPDEVAEMAGIAAALNKGLAAPNGDIAPGQSIKIPDYYYWRGQRVPTQAWLALTQEAQGIAGTTFDHQIEETDAPPRLILMSASAFRDPLIAFYLHHEMGHAVADVLASRDAAYASALHEKMGARMEADRAAGTLLRPYAGSEPDEFLADAFAARFLPAPASVATEAERQQQALCSETLLSRDREAWLLAADMVARLR
ncbi:MAG: hypothetical protein EB084_19295 [Proteobacteria bacterium]|nr:hypothetical protein [Pseudomonadota bacterium]